MLRGRFTVEKARRLQRKLATQVIKEDMLPKTLRYVAGVDVSYTREWAFGAVAVLDYGSLAVAENRTAKVKTSFPYIPTFQLGGIAPPDSLMVYAQVPRN